MRMSFSKPKTTEDKFQLLAKRSGREFAVAYNILLGLNIDQADVFFNLAQSSPQQAKLFYRTVKNSFRVAENPLLPPPVSAKNPAKSTENPSVGRLKTPAKNSDPRISRRNDASQIVFDQSAMDAFRPMHRIFGRAMKHIGVAYRIDNLTRGAKHLEIVTRLGNPDCLKILTKSDTEHNLAMAMNVENVIVSRDKGSVEIQIELPSSQWITYTRADVAPEALGIASRSREVIFEFTETSPHTRIQGTTGSGKSVAIQSTALSVMSCYRPDECRLVMIDHHYELDDRFSNAAHLDYPLALNKPDAREAVLYAHSKLVYRRENNIKDDYRLVVLMDEMNELLDIHTDIVPHIQELVNGRKYRVNVVGGVHDSKSDLLPMIADRMTNTFVGKTGDAAKNYSVTGLAGVKPNLLAGGGDFYHILNGRSLRFQVAEPTSRDFDSLPRAEIVKPYFEPAEIVLPQDVESPAGRPSIEVNFRTLAKYLSKDEKHLTRSFGESVGLKRTGHDLHKKKSNEVKRTLTELGYCIVKCQEDE